ncbi:zinc finger (C2H2 type) family protein [Melia azedarach]|uniref:Zinc finger (C2H2 type) family protein n=1 Tax=Melia azedarach TaxID=155640 RepID=A0ACC1XSY7_MELAZ|nr:zinc finger (C2H2 type) family protein [Melia azedarach]
MASPGKSPENPQETGGSSNVGGGFSPEHPTVPAESENVSPTPQRQVEGGDTSLKVEQAAVAGEVAVTQTPATENVEIPAELPAELPAEQGPHRKRERTETAGASASGERKQKKKGELVEIPSKSPSCYVCGREFQSWKAVFGHMRAHKVGEERAASGAFPPPVFTPPGRSPEREQKALQEQLVPALLDIAQVLTRTQESATGSASAPPGGEQQIDLNVTQEASPAASAPASPGKGGTNFDLNRPPPDNGGDDEGNAGGTS